MTEQALADLYARGVSIARLAWMTGRQDNCVLWQLKGGQMPPTEADLARHRLEDRNEAVKRIRANIDAMPSMSMWPQDKAA